ncbi:hypothetical protein COCCADRAFT_1841 [Bipolaris zeicola 26-R-13]|uniref:Ketoreductase (KR) domain-containing protein n=1 Tax=Cochliobolus carbonum (strain 26-R-13) TaxID=930089 RepID=W6YCJ6_COCC2|nr:uncharacterized protein COCCADRAFT_1841 [Bipolaris zeicola 26-R-13]EUC37257.1 hypothetical protein COCCADRAFT_1841 [Bipolaris zeicola 26-R-13]
MPDVETIRSSIAQLPDGPPLVVALIGGTSGIGSYVAQTFASTFAGHGAKLRVYLVGRNAERAERLMQSGRETSAGSEWRFIRAKNLALMSEVDAVSEEIIRQEEAGAFAGGPPRLDALYMSSALSPLAPSPLTEEGIDSQMSLLYYSRIRFIQNLSGLLRASPTTAHVISIFAGSVEDQIKAGEVPIGAPEAAIYSVTEVRKRTCFMKTFIFELLAEQHEGKISFVHIYPGLVDGPTFLSEENPLWFRILWRVLKPLASWYMTSPEVCGQVMVSLSTGRYPAKGTLAGDKVAFSSQREMGGGAYAVGQRGDERKEVSWAKARRDDTAKKVWEHTMGVLQGVGSWCERIN